MIKLKNILLENVNDNKQIVSKDHVQFDIINETDVIVSWDDDLYMIQPRSSNIVSYNDLSGLIDLSIHNRDKWMDKASAGDFSNRGISNITPIITMKEDVMLLRGSDNATYAVFKDKDKLHKQLWSSIYGKANMSNDAVWKHSVYIGKGNDQWLKNIPISSKLQWGSSHMSITTISSLSDEDINEWVARANNIARGIMWAGSGTGTKAADFYKAVQRIESLRELQLVDMAMSKAYQLTNSKWPYIAMPFKVKKDEDSGAKIQPWDQNATGLTLSNATIFAKDSKQGKQYVDRYWADYNGLADAIEGEFQTEGVVYGVDEYEGGLKDKIIDHLSKVANIRPDKNGNITIPKSSTFKNPAGKIYRFQKKL